MSREGKKPSRGPGRDAGGAEEKRDSATENSPAEGGGKKVCRRCGREFPAAAAYHLHSCPVLGGPDRGQDAVVAVARLVYTHNPFYLVSASLVLYGLSMAFRNREGAVYGWMLLGTFAGYAALLVLMAVAVVRLGKVWDDARTILLTAAIVLVAMSASFDQFVIERPATGVPLLLAGLFFAAGLSEGLMRGTGIRMPALFRAPYYAVLAFLFLYPLVLVGLLKGFHSTQRIPVSWGLFLFPAAAAGVFLSLVPAIRRGSEYAKENGTPWKWPWFPWVLFALLALAACARSYWLTISFYPVPGMQSPWGLYFLAPLVVGAAVIVLEIGIASARPRLTGAALVLPLVAVAIAFPGSPGSRVKAQFLSVIVQGAASPALMAALAAMGFYLYAWVRGRRFAEAGLVTSLLALSVIDARTTGFVSPRALPILAVAVVQAWQACRGRASWRALLAIVSAAAALAAGLRGTWFTDLHGAIPLHLIFAGALTVGAVYRDRFAKVVQNAGAFVMAGLFAVVLFGGGGLAPEHLGWAVALYLAALAATTLGYWLEARNVLYLYALLFDLAALAAYLGGLFYGILKRPDRPRGAVPLFWGGAFFLVAAFISLVKGGIVLKALQRLRALTERKEMGGGSH